MSLLMDALKKVEKKAETTMDVKSEAPANLLMDALQKAETQSAKPELSNNQEILEPVAEKPVEMKPEMIKSSLEQVEQPSDSSLVNEDELLVVEIEESNTTSKSESKAEMTVPLVEQKGKQKSDSSSVNQEGEEELFLFEIKNDAELKTIGIDPISGASNWEQELVAELTETDSQTKAEIRTEADSEPTEDFSCQNEVWNPENPFSPFPNDKTKSDFTSHNWEDEILPQFQKTENQSEKWDSSEIEFSDNNLSDVEPSNDSFREGEPLAGKPENDDEVELTLPKTSDHYFQQTNELESSVSTLKVEPLDFTLNKQPTLELKKEPKTVDKEYLLLGTETNEESNRPEKAKRVFAASTPPPSSKRTLWLSGILGILLVTMGASYYYYSHLFTNNSLNNFKSERRLFTMDSTTQTSTSDSKSVETTVSQSSPVSKESTHTVVSSASVSSSVRLTKEPNQAVDTVKNANHKPAMKLAETQVTTPSVSATQARMPKITKKTRRISSEPAKSAQSVNQNKHSEPPTKSQLSKNTSANFKASTLSAPLSSQPASKTQQQTELLAPKSSPSLPGVHALRKNVTPKINPELSKGYHAFQRGDDKTALQSYRNALRQDRNNRHALLGLAAVAMRNGNKAQAQQYYRHVLQLNPQDTYAQVGLINTLDKQSLNTETQLKLLLEQNPEAAYIHFSLGNLYASQGQWTQAQQAYFDAYRNDKNQADYAYNLAVSLDYLNQPHLALSYYQQALQLAKNQAVNFSPSAVQKRVQSLLSLKKAKASALANLPNETF